jgi:dienelactone hydrolase
LRITVNPLSTLPAYLLVPCGITRGEKRPGLLVSHGHNAHGMDTLCGVEDSDGKDARFGAYARLAVRSGYVVIVPAWWGWTGRSGHLGLIGARDPCNVIQMASSMYGLNVLDLHIQDAQAAVDVLAAREEVDASRIGCVGNSYGGRTAMWFTIFDNRIRACVAAGCMNTFRERSLKLSSCGIQYPHGILRYADVQELFCLIAPRSLQLQAGDKDELIVPAGRDAIEKVVRRAYQRCGAQEAFDYVLHQEGHRLLWELAEPFLARHLGATGGGQ